MMDATYILDMQQDTQERYERDYDLWILEQECAYFGVDCNCLIALILLTMNRYELIDKYEEIPY